MKSQLQLLVQACPPWFEILDLVPDRLDGLARVEPWGIDGVPLTMRNDGPLTVGETIPGAVFPARCPERHIQADQSFCVGLDRPRVASLGHAENWWYNLHQFMECQAIAAATGLWPPRNALDHGEAGAYQQRALKIARKLRIEDAYWEAYFGHPSWLSTPSWFWSHPKDQPPTTRLRKPKVKKTRHARRLLLELVFVERRRRHAMEAYRKNAIHYGKCCGQMRDCALAKA